MTHRMPAHQGQPAAVSSVGSRQRPAAPQSVASIPARVADDAARSRTALAIGVAVYLAVVVLCSLAVWLCDPTRDGCHLSRLLRGDR